MAEAGGGTTVFIDRLAFPIFDGPPPPCHFIVVEGQTFNLVMPKEIKDRYVWFLRKRIEVGSGSVLIRIYMQDGKLMGSSKVRFSNFQGRHVAKFPLKQGFDRIQPSGDDGSEKICFQLEFLAKATAEQTTKKVYLIRHAESRWNEAQEKNWWDKALSEVDHGVSMTGAEQAIKLRETLGKVLPNNSLIALVSPHRRTVQTALLATRTARIHLDPRMREHTPGPDGHANTVGEQIVIRAKEELLKVGIADMSHAVVDYSSVQESWWSNRFETTKKVDVRIKDFLHDLQYLPEDRIVIVGHSIWFKRMFNIIYSGGSSRKRQSDMSGQEESCSSAVRPPAGQRASPNQLAPKPAPMVDLMNMDADLLSISSEPPKHPPPQRQVNTNAGDLMNMDLLGFDVPNIPASSSSPALSSNARPAPGRTRPVAANKLIDLSGDDDDDEDDAAESESETDLQKSGSHLSAEECAKREMGRMLRQCKLPNCGCVVMEFVWDGSILPQINGGELIHGEIEAPPDAKGLKKKLGDKDCVIC